MHMLAAASLCIYAYMCPSHRHAYHVRKTTHACREPLWRAQALSTEKRICFSRFFKNHTLSSFRNQRQIITCFSAHTLHIICSQFLFLGTPQHGLGSSRRAGVVLCPHLIERGAQQRVLTLHRVQLRCGLRQRAHTHQCCITFVIYKGLIACVMFAFMPFCWNALINVT
jgi:hypothetical protein